MRRKRKVRDMHARRTRRRNPPGAIVLAAKRAGRSLYYDRNGMKFTASREHAAKFDSAKHAAVVARVVLKRYGTALRGYRLAVVRL